MNKFKNIFKRVKHFIKSHKKLFIGITIIIFVICLLILFFARESQPNKSSITVLDVGNAECIFIKSGNEYVIYDAGYDENHKTTIDDYIRTYQIKNIKALILSHNDKNNINGAEYLLEKYNIDSLYMSNYGGSSQAYKKLLEFIEENDINVLYPNQGSKIVLYDGVITFIQPDNIEFVNNDDASLCIQYQDSRLNRTIMTGGASSIVEKEILKYVKKIDKDKSDEDMFYTRNFLIMGRNGSDNATSKSWVEYFNPEMLLASTSSEQLSDRLTKLFAEMGKAYSLTSNSSTIEIVFDDSGFSMSSINVPTIEESFKSESEAQQYAKDIRKEEIENHPYVGNRNTNIYYDHDNPIVDTIMDSYITYFNSAQQAEENGFTYSK